MELETHLIISQKLSYLNEAHLARQIEEIGRMLNGLIQSLKGRQPRGSGRLNPNP
jgi:four helix bundle protein